MDNSSEPELEISSHENEERSIESLFESDISPDQLRRSLIESITGFERSFRKQFPLIWGATLVGPMLLTIALLLLISVVCDQKMALDFVKAGVSTFVAFGRFVILFGHEGGVGPETDSFFSWFFDFDLTPGQLFAMLTYMDISIALFVSFHMGILFRFPWLGEKVAGLASDGYFIMEQQPWLRRIAIFGLIGFVIFPTSTTGSIGGSIFGRLLGLGRFRTVLGVMIGSIAGNGIMYFFAKEINEWIGPDTFWLKLSGILILVLGVMLIEIKYRQAKNRYLEKQLERQQNLQTSESTVATGPDSAHEVAEPDNTDSQNEPQSISTPPIVPSDGHGDDQPKMTQSDNSVST